MTSPAITIDQVEPIGPFTYRWPAGEDEPYERGWSILAHAGDREVRVRHGLGRRAAYGRDRVRSVTWVELDPTVEGVEADDYEQTRELVSGLRTGKAFLRPGDTVPEATRRCCKTSATFVTLIQRTASNGSETTSRCAASS